MGSLTFGAKMALIGAIFMLPITLLIVMLHMQMNGDVTFFKQELLGVTYTRALRPLFADLETDRLVRDDRVARTAVDARVDADFAAAFAADAGPGHALGLTTSLEALKAKWRANATPDTLLNDFIALLGSVSDNSKITLDPMLDGYYVGDTMVNKIPSLIDTTAQATVVGTRWLRTRHLSSSDRIAMTILAGRIEIARAGIDHNLPIAIANAPYLESALDARRRQADDSSLTFARWLKSNLLEPATPRGSTQALAAGEAKTVVAAFALYDGSIGAMDQVLRKRIDALIRREIAIFLVVLLAIAVAAALMIVTSHSMSRHLADKTALEHEIVERTHVERQLAHAAFHDKLTGLSNRARLTDRLTEIVAEAHTHPHPWAILFLDLDRFKVVNDSLGHIAGDMVLVQAARRFARCVRSCDMLARLGGDEFIILLEDIDDARIAHEVANRALRAFDVPFNISGREVFASASIGIAMSHSGNDLPEDMLRNADIAMYRAKALGKNRYEMFTPDLLTSAITRLEVETDLSRAVERGEFRLFYQPIISLQDGHLEGFEALVRWLHPTRGMVNPDQFISIAEENGAIVAIGKWILEAACRQLQTWRTTLANAQDFRMNINVSAKQLAAPGFTQTLLTALSACDLRPEAVNMEITESVLIEDAERARLILGEIKRIGVQIHLDDFGTGYSSLAYLRDFPIDALKIDKSFVSSSNARDADCALASIEIVRTIIALAQSLSLSVTAEGVETDAQREQLRALGCTRGQGYFYSRPMDASVAGAYIVARLTQGAQRTLERI